VDDPRTLARVLTMRALAKWSPRTVADRNEDLIEAWRLARATGERQLAGYAAFLGSDAAIEAGDLRRAAELLESLGTLSRELGQPIMEWYHAIARAKRAIVCGTPEEAERLGAAAHEIGLRAGQPDAPIWFLGQVFVARFLQGTVDRPDPDLPRLFEVPGSTPIDGPEFTPSRSVPVMVSAAASLMFCELGRHEDANRHLDFVKASLGELPQDYTTLPMLSWASAACAQLGDAAVGARLHMLLEPYDGQFVNTGGSWIGAVGHYLALLQAMLGDLDGADAKFAAAERAYEMLGARSWLARCRLDWARSLAERDDAEVMGALLDRDGPGRASALLDRDAAGRASALLDQVLEAARQLEMPRIAALAEELRAGSRTS
jgi:hypothetical protein